MFIAEDVFRIMYMFIDSLCQRNRLLQIIRKRSVEKIIKMVPTLNSSDETYFLSPGACMLKKQSSCTVLAISAANPPVRCIESRNKK